MLSHGTTSTSRPLGQPVRRRPHTDPTEVGSTASAATERGSRGALRATRSEVAAYTMPLPRGVLRTDQQVGICQRVIEVAQPKALIARPPLTPSALKRQDPSPLRTIPSYNRYTGHRSPSHCRPPA